MRKKLITKCIRVFITNCDIIITNWDSYFITKYKKSLSQIILGLYYNIRHYHYQSRQLLENASFIEPVLANKLN